MLSICSIGLLIYCINVAYMRSLQGLISHHKNRSSKPYIWLNTGKVKLLHVLTFVVEPRSASGKSIQSSSHLRLHCFIACVLCWVKRWDKDRVATPPLGCLAVLSIWLQNGKLEGIGAIAFQICCWSFTLWLVRSHQRASLLGRAWTNSKV